MADGLDIRKIEIPEGLYKIKTTEHKAGKQPAGWGLAAWNAYGAKRNNSSSMVAVHSGNVWPMIWKIVKGKKNQILTDF